MNVLVGCFTARESVCVCVLVSVYALGESFEMMKDDKLIFVYLSVYVYDLGSFFQGHMRKPEIQQKSMNHLSTCSCSSVKQVFSAAVIVACIFKRINLDSFVRQLLVRCAMQHCSE